MLEGNKRIFWSSILKVKIKDVKKILEKILENKKKHFKDKNIWIFGSIIKGEFVGGSDIDILIGPFKGNLSAKEISEIASKLLDGIEWYYPIQVHILDDYSKEFFEKIEKIRLEEFLLNLK